MLKETQKFLTLTLTDISLQDIPTLQKIIQFHRKKYYDENISLISDSEFDKLFALLVAAEEKWHITDGESPTQKVHKIEDFQFQKETHITTMKSLDNTYNQDDLGEFEERIENILRKESSFDGKIPYFVELKFDGLGVSLTYEDGRLIKGVTRGNGYEGENITINIMQIRSIPKTIPETKLLEIRGEIIMPIASFEELNKKRIEEGREPFANPRNAASGSIRQLDWEVTRSRKLDFFAYSCPFLEQTSPTYHELLGTLEHWGCMTTPLQKRCSGIAEVITYISSLGKKPTYPFEIDGLVIKVDLLPLWNILGSTAHHPRAAIAYKFPATYERTEVLDIIHSVGRTGVVTPVAHVQAVQVGGVTVTHATLHNYDELAKKDVRIGDMVHIHRAGEVIPEIIAPIKELRTGKEIQVTHPDTCPVCQSELIREDEKVAWMCPNTTCPAKTTGNLVWFIGKHGLDIEGFGPERLVLFQELGWVSDFASIFDLKDHEKELLTLPSFKDKAVSNLLSAIETARKKSITHFIASLGIPGVGKKTASLIAPLFKSKEDVLAIPYNQEDIENIEGVGPVTAQDIELFFKQNTTLLSRLVARMEIDFKSSQKSSDHLSGKTFCVTGSFPSVSRETIHAMIGDHGGKTVGAISKNLSYLIVGKDAGSKLGKAKELGVACISFEELKSIIGI